MVVAGPDRRDSVLDGHLSGKLPSADPQRRRPDRRSNGACRARGGFQTDPRQGRRPHGYGTRALMGRFAPLLPELVLSIGGTILMMVAAFTGRRGSGLVRWLAARALSAATALLVGAPSHAGPVFDGLVTEDLFASFGRAIIYPAAAIAIIAAHGWFERGTEHAGEYAVLIVFSAVGMGVMVSATSLVSLYV